MFQQPANPASPLAGAPEMIAKVAAKTVAAAVFVSEEVSVHF